ncbi:MAG: hypothetical protein VX438_07150 [Planctomycetota bacterium]|nr:hypothetical protein [Planctomycetota bacterium]
MKHLKIKTGGTLVEVAIAALITGALLVPVLNMMGYTATSYSKQAILDQANLLSLELMSEILAKPFQENDKTATLGPDPGEVHRSDFDDLDDYHNLHEQPPTDAAGHEIPGAARFRRLTSIQYANNPGTNGTKPISARSQSDFKKITIEIYLGDKLVKSLQTISCRSGLAQSSVNYGGTITENVRAHVRLAGQAFGVGNSTQLLNRIPEELARD